MTEQPETPDGQPVAAADAHVPALASPEPATSWAPPDHPQLDAGPAPGTPTGADRPEIAVGASFAGGFLLALVLKRLAR